MIDWLTISLPLIHTPIPAGRIIKISKDGEIEWATPERTFVTGSYDTNVSCRSRGELFSDRQCTLLEISGNPAKFLQGHNIYGSDNLLLLVEKFVIKIADILKIRIGPYELDQIRKGVYTISRIDITYSLALTSRSEVQQFIQALDYKARTRSGKGCLTGNTLYFNKSSRRWAIKFYSKGAEIQKHQLHDSINIESQSLLYAHADNLLRIELTLRSLELSHINLRNGSSWANITPVALWGLYLSRLDMSAQLLLNDDIAILLTPSLRCSYLSWKDGLDLRTIYSNSKFYAHRRKLLKHGIDIALSFNNSEHLNNVVPLIRFLEAKPVGIPDFAYRLGLVA